MGRKFFGRAGGDGSIEPSVHLCERLAKPALIDVFHSRSRNIYIYIYTLFIHIYILCICAHDASKTWVESVWADEVVMDLFITLCYPCFYLLICNWCLSKSASCDVYLYESISIRCEGGCMSPVTVRVHVYCISAVTVLVQVH